MLRYLLTITVLVDCRRRLNGISDPGRSAHAAAGGGGHIVPVSSTASATGILQNLTDIQSASITIAGVTIHEYLDAWWKFGFEDSLSQDPDDVEEWFGIVRLVPDGAGYSTEPRPVYVQVRTIWGP